jgi:hypothetical protein
MMAMPSYFKNCLCYKKIIPTACIPGVVPGLATFHILGDFFFLCLVFLFLILSHGCTNLANSGLFCSVMDKKGLSFVL